MVNESDFTEESPVLTEVTHTDRISPDRNNADRSNAEPKIRSVSMRGDNSRSDSSNVTQLSSSLDSGRGGLVTARGTADGLVLRLDGRVGIDTLKLALSEFIEPRRAFLIGNEIGIEWVGRVPDDSIGIAVIDYLRDSYSFDIKPSSAVLSQQSKRAPAAKVESRIEREPVRAPVERHDIFSSDENVGPVRRRTLFDGMSALDLREEGSAPLMDPALTGGIRGDSRMDLGRGSVSPAAWDDPDARIVYGTIRSGQRIESEHSLIVVGDVNPGAEVVAGGDIIVLGNLRGIAHAGAYDESGGGRVIFAITLQPTQLRIGTTISRGGADGRSGDPKRAAEMARVEGSIIVVEPYNARSSWFRRYV